MPPKGDKPRFPAARIKKMMQADEDVGRIAAGVPPLVSKCLELFGAELLEKATAAASRQQTNVLQVCHIKEAVDGEQLFDFLREIVSECPVEQNLPGAPRKQKSARDESTAPKRQKAAAGKVAAAVSSAGASSTLDPPPGDVASSLQPLLDAGFGADVPSQQPVVSTVDLFGGALDHGSRTLEDDGDDYDAE
mmetsp:Transcript_15051/g.30440  ORF Transcript_15051/g.30440 Transcript_15051/m.30440 type:complete len:192 (-) Transcript_15051:134-709(-)|eukprot:CAMPEP_0119069774 /NCGR_PEP_ID=MMETSP1178-20130426/28797_1 /TAXON_ID=33656 /ORGANISM="unid sp, Strain CCMP2000" /LENGTH=191 /DNA_ID=CAMNT_0007051569 /DNA_START=16 /DNA_END=591 /DNA_ORIENTATION=-